jgi:preprotein translocase subunit SecA
VDLDMMFQSITESLVTSHKSEGGSFESFRQDCISTLGIDPNFTETEWNTTKTEALTEQFLDQFYDFYHRKEQQLTSQLLPTIKQVHEREGQRYRRIAVPFTDGRTRMLPIAAELEDAVKSNGKSIMRDIEKAITLAILDEKWKEHLRSMDELKESVQSASFEQKDPLIIYKMEAYKLFEELVYNINEEVSSYLSHGTLAMPANQQVQQAREPQRVDMSKMRLGRPGEGSNGAPATEAEARARAAAEAASQPVKQETIRHSEPRVGRNDPCPCGSGKKYKQCHGR